MDTPETLTTGHYDSQLEHAASPTETSDSHGHLHSDASSHPRTGYRHTPSTAGITQTTHIDTSNTVHDNYHDEDYDQNIVAINEASNHFPGPANYAPGHQHHDAAFTGLQTPDMLSQLLGVGTQFGTADTGSIHDYLPEYPGRLPELLLPEPANSLNSSMTPSIASLCEAAITDVLAATAVPLPPLTLFMRTQALYKYVCTLVVVFFLSLSQLRARHPLRRNIVQPTTPEVVATVG